MGKGGDGTRQIKNPRIEVYLGQQIMPFCASMRGFIIWFCYLIGFAQTLLRHRSDTAQALSGLYPNALLPYRSSLKYGRPSAAGGWFSLLFFMLMTISTRMVTTKGAIL